MEKKCNKNGRKLFYLENRTEIPSKILNLENRTENSQKTLKTWKQN